jgi:hypothetical protein
MTVGVALDVAGRCSYFIISTLVDFSCFLWKAESITLAVFLLHLELLYLLLETGKMNTFNQSETRKRWKTDYDWSESFGKQHL